MRPAVFLDRDGTLIEERNYLDQLDQIAPVGGVASALARLRDAGFALVVVFYAVFYAFVHGSTGLL